MVAVIFLILFVSGAWPDCRQKELVADVMF